MRHTLCLASQFVSGHQGLMDEAELIPDCTNCQALCCLALAFDKSSLFAIDKKAGTPCPNLSGDFTCRIYEDLENEGFQGCITYNCTGAGQRVCAENFARQNWRDNPEILAQMMEAFLGMRQIQEQRLLLHTAGSLPLGQSQRDQIDAFEALLSDKNRWRNDVLASFATHPVAKEIRAFLKSLAPLISQNTGKDRGGN